jgi:hypothetical protein
MTGELHSPHAAATRYSGRPPTEPRKGQRIHKTPVLARLLLSLAPFPATAQGRCPSGDIIVIDRSQFAPTI